MPALVKIKLKDCPGESLGEFRRLPTSDVTVCGTESLLVQVTFVPALMVSVDGLNEKFFISTETFSVAGTLGVEVSGAEVGGVGVTDVWVFETGKVGITFESFFGIIKYIPTPMIIKITMTIIVFFI
jgi:hypothetical protein